MKTIAYYLSEYGFGHATRSIAVIRRLCEKIEFRIIVCNAFAYDFLNQSLNDLIASDKVTLRKISNDIGYVLQPHSLTPDCDQFKISYQKFIGKLPFAIQREAKFLSDQHVNLVIGDIPPAPFKAALSLSIPSIGVSNFTWYTAYKELLPDTDLQPLYDCYTSMDYFFALAGSRERAWGRMGSKSFGFFSRSPQVEAVHKIRKNVNPTGDKIIVFFGLGMKIDAGNLAAYKLWSSRNCVFLVSSNTNIEGDNIYKIPIEDTESQNYIEASDIVISKPGWGTVSEAISFNKPLILVTRQKMQEDKNTIEYLKNNSGCELVEWEAMNEFEITAEVLERMKKQKQSAGVDSEDVINAIVEEICGVLCG
ncbi:glycosyltransferase [Sporolactobacillus nakayamae]|uniref:UDP-N-acetylglucosamine:LPS N-acetylglucosamine transferase n=1 Tax=Sporolactobacillus nakayamae TaxID=269670 RepID=A0A1I2UDZ9_9BACL|nr:glycosyltransferase [Sporolactobacillus nakayamae]SFG75374.1 UDP-N-acetylglucosamine:LPS N-acetylglucosamine transferase [Sporolactobacillus nakayamae]